MYEFFRINIEYPQKCLNFPLSIFVHVINSLSDRVPGWNKNVHSRISSFNEIPKVRVINNTEGLVSENDELDKSGEEVTFVEFSNVCIQKKKTYKGI